MSTECRCGRPTRDQAFVCDACADELNVALGEIPWLEAELETTIARTKGVDYRTKGGTASSERPSPVVWTAADARAHLRGVLVAWVKFCSEERVRNQSTSQALPVDTLAAVSRWLMWRVDGLALLDIGTEAVEEVTSAVAHCRRLIDKPPTRQYLGECDQCDDGRLYAKPGSTWARCHLCDSAIDAERLRVNLLSELDDRLCTTAEIADLSTYLGLQAGRDQVRKYIEYLSRKDRITRHSGFSDLALYRFGEVYDHLVKHEYGRKAAS